MHLKNRKKGLNISWQARQIGDGSKCPHKKPTCKVRGLPPRRWGAKKWKTRVGGGSDDGVHNGRRLSPNVLSYCKLRILEISGYTGQWVKCLESKKFTLTEKRKSHYLAQGRIKLKAPLRSPMRFEFQLRYFSTRVQDRTLSRNRS